VDTKDIKPEEDKKMAKEEQKKKIFEVKVAEMKNGEARNFHYYDMHSITALILSIFAILSPFMVFGLGGLLGVILGVIALYQVRQSRKTFDNDMNHTAKVLAVIGLVVSGVSLVISVVVLVSFANRVHLFPGASLFYMRPRMTYYHRFW